MLVHGLVRKSNEGRKNFVKIIIYINMQMLRFRLLKMFNTRTDTKIR